MEKTREQEYEEILNSSETLKVYEGGRGVGRMSSSLEVLRRHLESINFEENKPFVVMVSSSMVGGLIEDHIRLIELLKDKDVKIVCFDSELGTEAMKRRIVGYGFDFGNMPQVSSKIIIPELTLEINKIPWDESTQPELYKDYSKPINKGVGKMSMKGKSGYQLGSKFHR